MFFAAFKFSSWGVAMRAVAEDTETAALMGIRLGRVSMIAWGVAGVLAGVAGVFLVGAPTPGVTPGVAAVALRAFPAAILGGLDSTGGAVVGGLVVGLAESFAAGYQDRSPSWAAASVTSSRTSSWWRCCSSDRRVSSARGS